MGKQTIEQWTCDLCENPIDTNNAEWLNASVYGVAFHQKCITVNALDILRIMGVEVSIVDSVGKGVEIKYVNHKALARWAVGNESVSNFIPQEG